MPFAAACAACTSSATDPPTACSPKYSRTKARGLWSWRTSRPSARRNSSARQVLEDHAGLDQRPLTAMTRLWDKGAPLDARVLGYTAGDDYVLDNRLVRYDIQASIAHADMLAVQGLLSAQDLELIRAALTAIGEEHARGAWRISLEQEDCQTAIENLLTARIGAAGGRLHAGRSRNDQVLAALRLYLRDALEALAARNGDVVLPGYTHMQQAMPSSVALWARGFAAEIRDDAEGLAHTQRRIGKNPLGSAAGYGTPNLDVSRESTRLKLGFTVTQEPVTAVQLSRGKAEAQLLFEITLLTQDMGRLAADLLLFYTQEFG